MAMVQYTMAMKWNPLALEKWARAQSPSDWTTLLSLSPPRANLHLSTYLECVATLQRVLEEQKSAVSTKDHGRFWLALSRQLPPHNAKWPDNMHTSMKTTLIERIMHRVSMDPIGRVHWHQQLATQCASTGIKGPSSVVFAQIRDIHYYYLYGGKFDERPPPPYTEGTQDPLLLAFIKWEDTLAPQDLRALSRVIDNLPFEPARQFFATFYEFDFDREYLRNAYGTLWDTWVKGLRAKGNTLNIQEMQSFHKTLCVAMCSDMSNEQVRWHQGVEYLDPPPILKTPLLKESRLAIKHVGPKNPELLAQWLLSALHDATPAETDAIREEYQRFYGSTAHQPVLLQHAWPCSHDTKRSAAMLRWLHTLDPSVYPLTQTLDTFPSTDIDSRFAFETWSLADTHRWQEWWIAAHQTPGVTLSQDGAEYLFDHATEEPTP